MVLGKLVTVAICGFLVCFSPAFLPETLGCGDVFEATKRLQF